MFNIIRVAGYSCPSKYLLMFNGKPVMFANSQRRLSLCIQYIEGYDTQLLDGKIKRILDKIKGEYYEANR